VSLPTEEVFIQLWLQETCRCSRRMEDTGMPIDFLGAFSEGFWEGHSIPGVVTDVVLVAARRHSVLALNHEAWDATAIALRLVKFLGDRSCPIFARKAAFLTELLAGASAKKLPEIQSFGHLPIYH
jgi:hypothetical protein